MSYQAEISRVNPSCFLFLIDQSGSMADKMGGEFGSRPKSVFLADAINKILQNLVIKCAKSEGIRDYYHMGVIGYGDTVAPVISNSTIGNELIPISEIAKNPLRIEERSRKVDDGAGGILEQKVKFPVWFDATSSGGTPMNGAIKMAESILSRWVGNHPNSFPPIVMNFTDGEATDGDPKAGLKGLSSITTPDGPVLVFNIHISSTSAAPISFPSVGSKMPDPYAELLFEASSNLTPYMASVAKEVGMTLGESPKCFVFNADADLVIKALEIGTRPSNLR